MEALFRDSLGVSELLGYRNVIYPDLVAEFYANIEVVKRPRYERLVLRTGVCDKNILISEAKLCRFFNFQEGGIVPTELT